MGRHPQKLGRVQKWTGHGETDPHFAWKLFPWNPKTRKSAISQDEGHVSPLILNYACFYHRIFVTRTNNLPLYTFRNRGWGLCIAIFNVLT